MFNCSITEISHPRYFPLSFFSFPPYHLLVRKEREKEEEERRGEKEKEEEETWKKEE